MAKDYAAISKKIVENIGGVENIASVTHCMTRLRFVVKDEGKINDAAVKATDGVMGVVNQGGQYQIIIGNHVEEAYNEVLKMGDFGEASQVARGEKKEPLTLKKVGNNILDAIVGTMSPLIPAIIGGSMVKLLVMLLGMAGVLSADGETYKILNTIGDAAFYFLPVMVAASASKKFNTNMFIAIAIAGLMLHPDFRTMMEAVTVGDTAAHFLGIPVVGVKYTYTVIPALCMTWILSYIERAIDKITPAVTKNFLKPMLIFLIAAPIAIIVVGPAGIMIGEGISAFVYFVQAKLGFLAVGIMGALWPLLVITGMHRVFTPTILQTISETGMEGTVMPSEIGANLSLGGVSLAVAFKTKNSELRQTALAAASSALIAGTTEPALYGVAVRLKRPLIASLITGFVCGCLAGMAGLASRSMVSASVLTGVQFIDPANPGVSIAWIAGISVLSIVLSFVLTLVIGGAASGKSEYAESLVLRSALPRYYLATMQVWDAECAARVEKHRRMRAAKQFETVECPLHLDAVHLPACGTALLEDLGNLTANELYDPAGAGPQTAQAILSGLDAVYAQCETLIVVSNEVFSGGADYAGDTGRYLKALAQVNNALAARADHVVRVVCGIPVYYKGVEK